MIGLYFAEFGLLLSLNAVGVADVVPGVLCCWGSCLALSIIFSINSNLRKKRDVVLL